MAFGWFSKKKSGGSKVLQKADKLAEQGRWAEALTYYEEASEADDDSQKASQGLRRCREHLVEWNLEEARAYERASEPEKAREHASLALDLAAGEEDLAERAGAVLHSLGDRALEEPPAGPERLFSPSCPGAASCAPDAECAEAPETGEAYDLGELFEFYLESLSAEEKEAFESLGETFRKGFVLMQQGETEPARPLLEAAAAQAPDAVGPRYALGLLASLEHNLADAEEHFAQALNTSPGFAPAAHHRCDVLREAGKPAEAAALLESWLGEDPQDGEARVILAACRLDLGEPAQALEAAEIAERGLAAADPRPKLVKAQALRLMGRQEQALEELQAVAVRRPDLLAALVPLGQLLIEQGGASAERAAEVFKRCYRLEPERGWWHLLRVAQAYTARGWKAEAREVLETVRRELPGTPEAQTEWDAVSKLAAD